MFLAMRVFKMRISGFCSELRTIAQWSPAEHRCVQDLSVYLDRLIASDNRVNCSELRVLIMETYKVNTTAMRVVKSIEDLLIRLVTNLFDENKDLKNPKLNYHFEALSQIDTEISMLMQQLPIEWPADGSLTFSVADIKVESNDYYVHYYRWHLLYSRMGISRALKADQDQQEGWLNAARHHLKCAFLRTNPDSKMAKYIWDVGLQVLRAMEAAGMSSRFEEASTAYSWPKDDEVWPTFAKRARADAGGAGSAKRPRLGSGAGRV